MSANEHANASRNYTQTTSKIGFWAARKLPRTEDRKRVSIKVIQARLRSLTPGFWRSRKTNF